MKYNKTILDNEKVHYQELVVKLDKKGKKALEGKDTTRGKMLGFLSPDYYKRGKLLINGDITYGYTFRLCQDDFSIDKPVPTWVLFSPEAYFKDNPELFSEIAGGLDEVRNLKKTPNKETHYLKVALEERYSEPKYLEVPPPYNKEHLVYISLVYLKKTQIPDFRMGINLVVISQDISKEVLYVPTEYWTDEFKKLYYEK